MYVVFLQLQDKYSSSYLNLWGGKGKEEPGELKHGVYGNMQRRAVGATTNGTVMASCFAYLMYTMLVYYVCVGYSAATQRRHTRPNLDSKF